MSSYGDYLKSRYGAHGATSTTQWPPVPTNKVFKLAMIQKEQIQRGKVDEDLIRLSITGKVDDILQQKTPFRLQDIFSETDYDIGLRRFALIDGAPGCGKSTLALHICQEWAEGRLFQEFVAVVLVRLRDPAVRNAKTVADLLPCSDKTMADKTEAVMISKFGKGVLFVFDGFDELPSNLPPDSIINKLIQPGMSQNSPLHKCALIVTSRPSSSAKLHPLVTCRIEVLGFSPNELEDYFTECLKGNTQAVQTLMERIRQNPVVEGSCYLPLNSSIIAHVYLSGDHSLPTSNHGIFISLVQNSLKRYLQDRLGSTTRVGDITSPDSLPSEIQTPFIHLCQLAFHGIENDKVTFSTDDFEKLCIPENVCELGLLQSVPSIISDGHLVYFCFLHLSIHELLSAIHITTLPPKQQISIFETLFDSPRFSAVLQFYAGLTKLRTKRPVLSLLPRFLCPVPASVYDLVRKIVKTQGHNPKPLFVSLLHCLYEAEDIDLCRFVANHLNSWLQPRTLCLSRSTLSPLDCLSAGYFSSAASATSNGFIVNFRSCFIGSQECKFLTRGLSKYILDNPQSNATAQLDLDLGCNSINEGGIHHIAGLLKSTSIVCKLNLSENMLGFRGLKSLCEALADNTTLRELYLWSCSLTISDNSPLYELLTSNKSIKILSLHNNRVTDCYHIAAGLKQNNTLKTLDLSSCRLTDQCLNNLAIGPGMSNYIEALHIHGNASITERGLQTFAARHAIFSRLTRLSIPYSPIIDVVFKAINEERKMNGLPQIKVEWSSALPLCSPVVCSGWRVTPDIPLTSLEGCGEEADDEDNIAYSRLMASLEGGDHGSGTYVDPSHPDPPVFTHTTTHSGQEVSLSALHRGDSLYIYLSVERIASMSKECLISLLEHAEEELDCKTAFVFFKHSLSDEHKRQLIRDFNFIGFEILPPNHPQQPIRCSDYMFLGYEINPEGDSDDDNG